MKKRLTRDTGYTGLFQDKHRLIAKSAICSSSLWLKTLPPSLSEHPGGRTMEVNYSDRVYHIN